VSSGRKTFGPSRRDVLRLVSSAVLGAPIASSVAIADQGMPEPSPEGVFELGELLLESGVTLPNAKLAYKTRQPLPDTVPRTTRRHRVADCPGVH
jgi:hypothetical protein